MDTKGGAGIFVSCPIVSHSVPFLQTVALADEEIRQPTLTGMARQKGMAILIWYGGVNEYGKRPASPGFGLAEARTVFRYARHSRQDIQGKAGNAPCSRRCATYPFGCAAKQGAGVSAFDEKQGTPSPPRQAQGRPNPPSRGVKDIRKLCPRDHRRVAELDYNAWGALASLSRDARYPSDS